MELVNTGYVYAYLDPRKSPVQYGDYKFDHEPYYIGMSRADSSRKFYHINEALFTSNISLKLNKIRKLIREFGEDVVQSNIVVIRDKLSYIEASKLEIDLITAIGRADLGTGPLSNLTDGGDGAVGINKKDAMIRSRKIIDFRSPRSCYSRTPEESALANSISMKIFFDQNRNKTFADLPPLKYRRYYSNTLHGRSGSKNPMSSYYYLLITDDGGYHIANKGCMKYLAEKLGIAPTTIECSARDNERRTDAKFTRIMRGTGIGSFAFRFTSLSECPVNITMGNQQPRPRLPR